MPGDPPRDDWYGFTSGPSPDPPAAKPPAPPPMPVELGYAHFVDERPKTSVRYGLQAFIGGVCYVASVGGTIFAANHFRFGGNFMVAVWMVVVFNVLAIALVETILGWTGFKTGALIALGLSCLVGVGTVGVICGWFRH